jgi:4-amino-4-deoxy-L-arabinose transferase-like glycosyltransferase
MSTGVRFTREPSTFDTPMLLVWAIALAKLVLHTYFNDSYGFFRDEFDYLSCGEHLAWGYVDQPPLIPWLTELSRVVLGESLRAVRFIPALASALLVVQTALIARQFGARGFGVLLAAICVALAPQYLSNASLLGTNSLEPTLWMGCAYFAIRAVKHDDPRQWLWFGIIAGIGLEEKYTIALFGAGIVIGLLLTAQRRHIANHWFWLGGLAAFLIFLPNLWWNYANDWPFVQLMHAIRDSGRDVVLPFGAYFMQQTLLTGLHAAPFWLAGLGALLFAKRFAPFRFLGISFLICYAVLFAVHGKSYYLASIYPMLFAAGAALTEGALENPRRHLRWIEAPLIALMIFVGLYFAPIVVPVFSPENFVAYTRYLPFKLPVMEHSHERATLPQWYADQFGWKEISDATVTAWNHLPESDHADCGIFAQDYGQAGATDFFGRREGLPPVISGDRTYFLWGPRGYSGECMIVLDDRQEVLEKYWSDVKLVATSTPNPWALEAEIPVYICRHKKFSSLAEVWPTIKHWH